MNAQTREMASPSAKAKADAARVRCRIAVPPGGRGEASSQVLQLGADDGPCRHLSRVNPAGGLVNQPGRHARWLLGRFLGQVPRDKAACTSTHASASPEVHPELPAKAVMKAWLTPRGRRDAAAGPVLPPSTSR